MEEKKRVIAILGGGMKEENGKWRTLNFDEGDKFGATGDRLRVVAASYLYRGNSNSILIALGGKGQYKDIPGAPTIAEVIKKELIELGVPEKNITEECYSGNTFQQLEELGKIAKQCDIEKIIIISNHWHLMRIRAMLEMFCELKELAIFGGLELMAAEDILFKWDALNWEKIIKVAYESEGIKKRIETEEEGIRQIKEGKYRR